jgi:hypothetical protein
MEVMMKIVKALILLGLISTWFGSAYAQTAIRPVQIQGKVAPKVPSSKLPVLKPVGNLPLELQPLLSTVETVPAPDLRRHFVFCYETVTTRIAFQFHCFDMNVVDGNKGITLVLRRDGSEPSWAMNADDFDLFSSYLKDTKTAITVSNYTGDFYGYVWTVFSKKEQQAPPRYCSENTLKYINTNGPQTAHICTDIMAVSTRIEVLGR